jgi:hypothetical protein
MPLSKEEKFMTVGELIEALQALDRSLPVFSNQMYEPQTVNRALIVATGGHRYVLLQGWKSMSDYEWKKP